MVYKVDCFGGRQNSKKMRARRLDATRFWQSQLMCPRLTDATLLGVYGVSLRV